MKKVIKKNKTKPAQRKKCQKKREIRKNKKDKNLSLKEGLKKTKEDKVLLNLCEPLKNIRSLIRDIFNLKEAKNQIKFLGVDIKYISRHIDDNFFERCATKLGQIYETINSNKNHRDKKDLYFQFSKQYNRMVPHQYSIINIDSYLINSEIKIKRELRILELLKSYRELKLKDQKIRAEIREDNNSINLNESVNLSVNNNEMSVDEENLSNFSSQYYKKALNETDYLFNLIDRKSQEFEKIKKLLYRYSVENKCPYPKLKLLQLYRLSNKYKEFKEYENLYWYGCASPHLYSILRHGLRFPIVLPEQNIYKFGKGILISHNPYTQLQYCLPKSNTAYLFVCGNNGLKSKVVHSIHPDYPEKKKGRYDSVCIQHKIKLLMDEDDSEDFDLDYDIYCDYIVYDIDKINLLYLAKIEIP